MRPRTQQLPTTTTIYYVEDKRSKKGDRINSSSFLPGCSIRSSLNFARGCFRGYGFNDEAASLRQRRGRRRLPTTTTTYYGEDKRSKKGDRRLRGGGGGGGAGATLSGEARRFNQQCYVGVGSEWRGAAVQLTSARLHYGGGGGVAH